MSMEVPPSSKDNDSISASIKRDLEIEKLRCEIANLKRVKLTRIQILTPLISVVVAAAALGLSVFTFSRNEARANDMREDAVIASAAKDLNSTIKADRIGAIIALSNFYLRAPLRREQIVNLFVARLGEEEDWEVTEYTTDALTKIGAPAAERLLRQNRDALAGFVFALAAAISPRLKQRGLSPIAPEYPAYLDFEVLVLSEQLELDEVLRRTGATNFLSGGTVAALAGTHIYRPLIREQIDRCLRVSSRSCTMPADAAERALVRAVYTLSRSSSLLELAVGKTTGFAKTHSMDGLTFVGPFFKGTDFEFADVSDSVFLGGVTSGLRMKCAKLDGSYFGNVSGDFSFASLRKVHFGHIFKDTSFKGADLYGAVIYDPTASADYSDARWDEASFGSDDEGFDFIGLPRLGEANLRFYIKGMLERRKLEANSSDEPDVKGAIRRKFGNKITFDPKHREEVCGIRESEP